MFKPYGPACGAGTIVTPIFSAEGTEVPREEKPAQRGDAPGCRTRGRSPLRHPPPAFESRCRPLRASVSPPVRGGRAGRKPRPSWTPLQGPERPAPRRRGGTRSPGGHAQAGPFPRWLWWRRQEPSAGCSRSWEGPQAPASEEEARTCPAAPLPSMAGAGAAAWPPLLLSLLSLSWAPRAGTGE